MKRFLLNVFGVSSGDEKSVSLYRFKFFYLAAAGYKSFLRLLANHCIIPSLRIVLFRLSGVQIGKKVHINMNVNFIDGFHSDCICLEDEVSVAPFVSFVAESHPNNSVLFKKFGIGKTGIILVKSGAWLGVGSVIMPGVTIGRAAIVGANAVVTKDIDDFAIVAGVPANKIGDVRMQRSDSSENLKKDNL